MIVPVMAISNLVLTRQIYSEETNGAHAHYREPVPFKSRFRCTQPLRSKYTIIIVIYLKNHPPFPLDCYLYA